MANTQVKWIHLNKGTIWFLFILYFVFFIISTLVCIWIILELPFCSLNFNIFARTVIGSIFGSICGSTSYYIRKLYKHAIREEIIPQNKDNQIQSIGVFIYFFIRPFISLIMGPIMVIVLYGAIFKLIAVGCEPQSGFLHVCLILAFIGGFTTGHFIKSIDSTGSKLWKNVILKNRDSI